MYQSSRFHQALAAQEIPTRRCPQGIVKIVQFGDFECSECGRVAASLQAFRHRNDGVIDFAYKYFPSSALHRHALQAAEAAECARVQGRFWPMHNALVANQDRLDLNSLYVHAESVGLNMVRFESEMDDETHLPTIRSHIYSGTLAGVRRTPAYFVDGILVDTSGGLRALFDATSDVLVQRRGSGLPIP